MLQPGDRLGSYDIVGALGAGGMGEVFRARDSRLQRDVAIKALPAPFASDPERVARFEREAQALAALNHPGIAGIHELLEHGGTRFLILEYVPGDTLAARIARGAVPIDEAIPLALQLADALEAAHDRNIVHRDLKPANIIVTPDGRVTVLDFGLAKALDAGEPSAPLSQSPTLMTLTSGMILGTAAYMSPEQARGRAVDRRADIWAFGCVCYEMLTGTPAFGGDTVTDIIGAVMRAEPDWTRLPPGTPAAVERLLRRCLVKDMRERLPHIGVARLELRDALAPVAQPAAAPGRRGQAAVWGMLAAALLAVAALGLVLLTRDEPAAGDVVRFVVGVPEGTNRFGHLVGQRGPGPAAPHFALSPDGRLLAFAAVNSDNSGVDLWVQPLSSVSARRLPGTGDASFPFWSADSRSIAFFAGGILKTIAVDGEAPVTVCAAENGEGGTWGRDGTILFALRGGGIFRVSFRGGTPVPVTSPGDGGLFHGWPWFLPDHDSFLYFAGGIPGQEAVRIRSLASGDDREVLKSGSRAIAAAGHLLFIREGQLFAQPFDAGARSLSGEPRLLANAVASLPSGGRAAFSATDTGVLVYRSGLLGTEGQLEWWSRDGSLLEVVDAPLDLSGLALAADDSRAVVVVNDNRDPNRLTGDLWTYDFPSGLRTRFTSEPEFEFAPAWSPDGQTVAFSTGTTRRALSTGETTAVWIKAAGGAQPARKIADDGIVSGWRPDGGAVLVTRRHSSSSNDLWLLSLADGTAVPAVQTPFDERDGKYSPDGRWLAYLSEEGGQLDVYVQSVPAAGRKWRVSPQGGISPIWSADSRELYYASLGDVYVVKVTPEGVSAPTRLLNDVLTANIGSGTGRRFAVSRDGTRLLTFSSAVPPNDAALTVVLNWPRSLQP